MYDGVAKFYDTYTADLNHEKVADFAEKCFFKYGNPGIKAVASGQNLTKGDEVGGVNGEDVENSTLVLDCACGTGALTCILGERGYDMTGLDISMDMLYTAMDTAESKGLEILWLCQDMCRMDMYGSFAAVLCMTDGVNHITTRKRLDAFFKRIYNFVDDGGLLIFDFLTPSHFESRVGKGGNVFYEDGEEGTCLWTSRYNEKSGICEYDITVYQRCDVDDNEDAEELFTRTDDSIREKAWSLEEITESLLGAGFKVRRTCGSLSFGKVKEDSGRVYVVAKK